MNNKYIKEDFWIFFLMDDMNDKDHIYRINASSDVAVCLQWYLNEIFSLLNDNLVWKGYF